MADAFCSGYDFEFDSPVKRIKYNLSSVDESSSSRPMAPSFMNDVVEDNTEVSISDTGSDGYDFEFDSPAKVLKCNLSSIDESSSSRPMAPSFMKDFVEDTTEVSISDTGSDGYDFEFDSPAKPNGPAQHIKRTRPNINETPSYRPHKEAKDNGHPSCKWPISIIDENSFYCYLEEFKDDGNPHGVTPLCSPETTGQDKTNTSIHTQANPHNDDITPKVDTEGHGTTAATSEDEGNAVVGVEQRIKRFDDSASFLEYFEARPGIMRELLVQYSTAVTEDDIMSAPAFHLPLQVPDAAMAKAFFTAFPYTCFGIQAGCHVALDTGTARTILELLTQVYASRQAASDKAAAAANAVKAKLNAYEKGTKRQKYLELPSKTKAMNNVFCYLRDRNKTLTADGGDTNGELTRGSAVMLLNRCKEEHGLDAEATFADGGGNYNLLAALAAQICGCRGFGIEYVPVRTYVAACSFLDAMEDNANKGSLIDRRVAYVVCDLFNLRSLHPCTHAHFFDEAFDRLLYEHNVRVCANTRTLTHILSFKASKNRSLHYIMEKYGFSLVDQVHVIKTGSNENNTVYIYKRTSWVKVYWPDTDCNILTTEKLKTDYLDPAWGKCEEARWKLYEGLKATTGELLTAQKKARKLLMSRQKGKKPTVTTQPRGKCSCLVWWECSKHCTTCVSLFEHQPDAVKVGNSDINGKGLFAAKAIPRNKFAIQYTGEVIRLEEHNTLTAAQGRYTAKMDFCYINAVDAVEPHKYVNHSCNPNSRLLHWLSKDNEARLSIQVVRPVKSGDEITVDYGTIIPKSFQCTCFTCKTPLYGLAFDKGKDKDKDK
jgi:hypothetical protein